ncbi:M23 family metallopeptidase [Xylanivirga thermophila]|uniref:M23 family metallopeptidase n=1 Tax=Xylanivirga thermophila TaxID=2496273 RepID=UPI00101E0B5D|nr:M23 family metallopeptidase [Xylanivirga thermophila]
MEGNTQKIPNYPRTKSKYKYRTRPVRQANTHTTRSYNYRGYNNDLEDQKKTDMLLAKLIICVVIILLIVSLKSIDKPFAQKIVDKVRIAVTQDFDMEESFGKLKFIDKYIPEDIKTVFNADKDKTLHTADDDVKEKEEMQFIAPAEGKVVGFFGKQGYINGKRNNTGIDILAQNEGYVYCVSGGKVIEIWQDKIYGECAKIDHGNGISSVYAGVADMQVKVGQQVQQGDSIGKMSINDNGEYVLHFRMLKKEKPMDPLSFISDKNKEVQ